jgi:hypothetical protein
MTANRLLQVQKSYELFKSRFTEEGIYSDRLYIALHFFDSILPCLPDKWAKPYLIEIVPELYASLMKIPIASLPFDILIKVEKIFITYLTVCSEKDSPQIQTLIHALKRQISFLYLCIHEYEKCSSYLCSMFPDKPLHVNSIFQKVMLDNFTGSPLEWIELIKNHAKDSCAEILPLLDEYIVRLKAFSATMSPNKIRVLFVEQGRWSIQGHLKELYLSAYKIYGENSSDRIHINNLLSVENDPMVQQAKDALVAAKNVLLEVQEVRIAKSTWDLSISLPEKQHFYTGDSMGLALGILIFMTLLEKANSRKRCGAWNNVAITGSLSITGECLAVDENSLEAKLKAAFYSPIESVVIPSQNIHKACDIMKSLNQLHQMRHLNIVPLDTLKQTIDMETIVTFNQRSPVTHLAAQLKHHLIARVLVLAVVFGLLFGFIAKKLIPRPNPAFLDISGQFLRAYDSKSKILWNFNFGYVPGGDVRESIVNEYFVIDDLDGDGLRDVIFQAGNSDVAIPLELLFISNTGKLLRKYPIGKEFGKYDARYRPRKMKTMDIDADGQREVISVSFHRPFCPCHVQLTSFSEGIEGEYVHEGYLMDFVIHDINDDHFPEILLVGTNNYFRQAVIVVLDPINFSGYSRHFNEEYGVPAGNEKHYIRLPRSEYNKHKDTLTPVAKSIAVLNNGTIQVRVDEGWNLNIYFSFDYEFRLKCIDYSDNFLKELKENTTPGSEAYSCSQPIVDRPLYWDGKAWSLIPTMNCSFSATSEPAARFLD